MSLIGNFKYVYRELKSTGVEIMRRVRSLIATLGSKCS